jgi:hypothetical protein
VAEDSAGTPTRRMPDSGKDLPGLGIRGGDAAPAGALKHAGGSTSGRTEALPQLGDCEAGAAAAEDMLAQVLDNVDVALAHASKGEWDEVAIRDAECRAVVDALTSDAAERVPEELADGLSRIRERYRELLALAEAHRDQLAESVRSSVHGRAGARAYEENK